MSDTIEEIQSKKQRDAGLSAWAEMLERIQARQMAPAQIAEESSGGGCGLPRDTMQRQDPKVVQDRKLKLQAVQANINNMQTEARRMQDVVSVHQGQAQPKEPSEPKEVKAVKAPEVAHQQVQAHEVKHEEQVQAQAQQVEQLAEQAQVLEAQTPLTSNSVEASEKFVQLTNQAGIQQPAAEDKVEESAPLTSMEEAIEEAMQLMALKSGGNPELVAKDYVLASELPGVKDSLSGGVYEDFRVAL